MLRFLLLIDFILSVYAWLALAVMVLDWLRGFRVVTHDTYGVAVIEKSLDLVVGPVLAPTRLFAPKIGYLDSAPYVLLLIIMAVRYAMALYLIPKLV